VWTRRWVSCPGFCWQVGLGDTGIKRGPVDPAGGKGGPSMSSKVGAGRLLWAGRVARRASPSPAREASGASGPRIEGESGESEFE
jgi:hypothetical protein